MYEGLKDNGKQVIGERCECGHLRTEHGDIVGGLAVGHGHCKECLCKKFTWVSWVTEADRKAYFPNMHFDNGTEALVAIKKMSTEQKERMLMDLVWKAFEKPKGLTQSQLVTQAYNIAVMIPNENS